MKKLPHLLTALFLICSFSTALASGEALFQQNCKKCHGPAGKADTPMGKVLKMRDFSIPANQADVTDESIRDSIVNGRTNEKGRKVMLAFGDKFSAEEIEQLVQYFRSLQEGS
ncbi:MAG: cytochrome c [Puniceicoccaceae bacterium]